MIDDEKRNKEIKIRLTATLAEFIKKVAKLRRREIADQINVIINYYANGHLSGKLNAEFSVKNHIDAPRIHREEVFLSAAEKAALEIIAINDGVHYTQIINKAINEFCFGHADRIEHAEALRNKAVRD
jgi:hypothetical protein